jgi:uncharacterized damage-inducible protein DinB
MAEPPIALAPFYQGWETYQELLIKGLSPLTLEQLSLRTAPQLRSIGENVAHIIGVRAGWFYYVLEIKNEKLAALESWSQPDQPARSVAELVRGLEETWQVMEESINQWSADDLAVTVRDIDENGEEQLYTRQWVIWHLIEHDIHHGGEVSLTLGTFGLSGIGI